ncbi:MAG: ABC transporter permease [Acidobacteriota bacterium]|nr:ABC transporter permease [Acidobacteriota bacterium]
MSFWRRIKSWWPWSRLRAREVDLERELQTHIELEAEEQSEAGVPPEEARFAARRALGNTTQIKEDVRAIWGSQWLETLLQDIRFGLRQFRRNPAFTAVAVTVAALGIAAVCVVLSFAEAAVVRALPYKNPSRLVWVTMSDARFSHAWDWVSVPVFFNWRERAKAVGSFAASERLLGGTLAGVPEPTQVSDNAISSEALSLLGVRPVLGRGFLPSDYNPDSPSVVLLSYSLWQRLFSGRMDALGRAITLNGVGHTIVGVMPPGFTTPGSSDWESACWTPLTLNAAQRSDTQTRPLLVWGRLRVPRAQAEAALDVLALEVMRAHPSDAGAKWRITITPLTQQVVEKWRSILIVLFGAAGFLLAISCANVANLLLGRAISRQKEIAIRTAIGAGRWRILRQLLTESVILGALGGALGILLAYWGNKLELTSFPRALQAANFEQMGVDWRVLAATLGISFVAGIVFGLAPALHASKSDLAAALKEGGASAAPRRGRFTTQSILIVGEIAMSLVLLTGAGLMLRSFLRLEAVNPGVDAHQVLTMRVLLPRYRYASPSDQTAAYTRLLRKIKSVPGVEASGFISPLPLDGINGTFRDTGEPGMSNLEPGGVITGGLHAVSSGYFEAMGIPLLDGRDFTSFDTKHAPSVMIVNKAFVDRYWLGRSPVGTGSKDGRVVGEVGNVRDNSLAEEPRPEVYVPFAQKLFAEFAGTIVVRTRTPAATAVAMQKAIHRLDPEAPISQIETMRQVLRGSLSENRFYVVIVGGFALLALILALAGIASTVGYAVSARTHEIGLRMALGAQKSDVLWQVLSHGMMLALIGIGIGIAGALALTRFLSSLLYGVKPTDPLTFVAVSVILLGVALLACYIPARRAANVDPMAALRHE